MFEKAIDEYQNLLFSTNFTPIYSYKNSIELLINNVFFCKIIK